ncbi:flagellin lysine-N-methylase [Wukongibacter baidiensis]|uniref:flagellin lysine-N-methylase n=1 Tax=Wukongibacter baidiensis TaxID=1723361 RepID=UPI003D7FE7EB
MPNSSTEKTKILQPVYMNHFNCIGPTCEDNCCYGWNVDIDTNTYKKYQGVQHETLSCLINKSIVEKESSYKVKMKSNICPFFDKDKLCMIHKELGEEFLSNTCYSYPRSFNIFNDSIEIAASVSCPEVARLVLLNKDGIDFEYSYDFSKYTYLPKRMGVFNALIENSNPVFENSYMKYLWEIRSLCIDIIQNRNFDLDSNMILLGLFIENLSDCINDNKIDNISEVIDLFSRYINTTHTLDSNEKNNSLLDSKLKILFNILSKKASLSSISLPRLDKYYKLFLQGLCIDEQPNRSDLSEAYLCNYDKYLKDALLEYRHIFENYLVNYIFIRLFPSDSNNDIFKPYSLLSLNYGLLKFFLVGVSAYYKKLDEDLLVEIIQIYAKTFNHNSFLGNEFYKILKNNKLDSMLYTTSLIMD